MTEAQLFLDGAWTGGERTVSLAHKFTGEPVATVAQASPAQVDAAVGALEAAQRGHVLAPYERYEILARASRLLEERREPMRALVVADTGFTLADAEGEVSRAVQTLRLSAEEAVRLAGEMVPLEGAPNVRDRIGFTTWHPVGVVCAITPFNSPLNTVAHKVAPALAAGNAVVLKPASLTPLTAGALVELLLEAGLPPGHVALLHGSGADVGGPLLEDPRVGFYTFTGSTETGRAIQRGAGLRRTQLELGSLSSTLVCEDADLERAAGLCVNAAFRKAGQVCTSVQRLYVHRSVYEEFTARLAALLSERKYGDPDDPATFVGPMISPREADRVEAWVSAALSAGARALAGAERSGSVLAPTVLADVTPAMKVMCHEVFGPVVSLRPYEDLAAAVGEVNDTPYGLAAGVFTRDLGRGLEVARRLRMGSVHVNETSSSRVDLMPYGGVKDSGHGREGPRYAVREMSEERLTTISHG